MQKLPAVWQGLKAEWLTLKLRDDLETAVASVDKEFALFMESEKQRTAPAFQQAKVLKIVATLIALALFIIVMAGAFMIFKHGGLPRKQ
jgi:hypothetical protein